jgi:type II secretory pathway component GspD/PulD (secretin)
MLYKKKTQVKTRVARLLVVWLGAVFCLGTLVIGQDDMPNDNTVVLEGGQEIPAAAGESDGQSIQSLTFKKDTKITDALRFLAMKYQRNIIPSNRVDGILTITNLYDVTFEEALQAVIGSNRYIIKDNFIMVYTPEEYEQIMNDHLRREYRFFTLYYLTADEGKKMVDALLSSEGKVATSSQAAVGLSSGSSISDEAGGDNLAFQDTIVVYDYPENIARIDELLTRLDVRPLQVLVEATILSATLTEELDMGIDMNLAAGATVSKSTLQNWAVGGTDGTPIDIGGFATGTTGLKIGVTTGDIQVFITALEEITDVTVLANPKILAINKQLGQVYIGTKIGYREGDVVTDGGATQQGAVKFLDTGTKLAFRPYIGNDGFIRMDIHPKDSTGNLNVQGVPDETSAELRTNIIVKDGETIVIGGMFRDEITNTRSQVPLLGSLPIVGEAFKGVNDNVVRKEVIVLLTPHIITDPFELDGDDRMDDIGLYRLGTRDRLSWFGTTRLADDSYARAVDAYTVGDLDTAMEELSRSLHLRPNFLEAMRLRERICRAQSSDNMTMEYIMIRALEKEDAQNWMRY